MHLWLPVQIIAVCLLAISAVFESDWIGITDIRPAVINTTHSMPTGIYIRTWQTPTLGSIVTIPLPAIMHDYVNAYPAWSAWFNTHPLLKVVVGTEGTVICRNAVTGDFEASGRVLGVAASHGPDGRALPSWAGCRRLNTDEIAVFGGGLPDSVDSRYWGASRASDARTYRMLWSW